MPSISGTVAPAAISGTVGAATISGSLSIVASPPRYTGETYFTPSMESQTIPTAGRVLESDLTVGPIPSNYGLITWNGSYLTVS